MLEEIEKLNSRDKEIIEYRYGLNGKKELTQKEVAKKFGIEIIPATASQSAKMTHKILPFMLFFKL